MGLHEMTLILLMALENSVPEIIPQKNILSCQNYIAWDINQTRPRNSETCCIIPVCILFFDGDINDFFHPAYVMNAEILQIILFNFLNIFTVGLT